MRNKYELVRIVNKCNMIFFIDPLRFIYKFYYNRTAKNKNAD